MDDGCSIGYHGESPFMAIRGRDYDAMLRIHEPIFTVFILWVLYKKVSASYRTELQHLSH